MVQVIIASRSEWIAPFTGLEPGQFRKLVRLVAQRGGDEIADGRPGRQWALPLADRVLLVAVYWRTNLTMRQIGPLFGVSHSAAHRVIDKVVCGQSGFPVDGHPRTASWIPRWRPVSRSVIAAGSSTPRPCSHAATLIAPGPPARRGAVAQRSARCQGRGTNVLRATRPPCSSAAL